MDKTIKKFRRIYNISLTAACLLYIISVIVISALSAKFERGGFFTFGFDGYFLILGLITLPFAVSLLGTALIVKETVLYKKYGTQKQKFILLTISYFLIALMGILAVIGLAFTVIDIMLMLITVLAILSSVLIIIAYTKKNKTCG